METKETKKRIPFCHKCADREVRPFTDYIKGKPIEAFEVVGCKKLSKEEWDKGMRPDKDKLTYQHNCPLPL